MLLVNGFTEAYREPSNIHVFSLSFCCSRASEVNCLKS